MSQSAVRRLRRAVLRFARRPRSLLTRRPTLAARPPRPRVTLVRAAREAGWRLNEPRRAFLEDIATACSGLGRPPTVAVLAPPAGNVIEAIISRSRPRARVCLLDPVMAPSALHTALAAAGPFDLVVDASTRGSTRADLFRNTFFHLRPGGSYIVWNLGLGAHGLRCGTGEETVLGLVARLAELGSRRPQRRPKDRSWEDERVLARAIRRVRIGNRHLVVVSRVRALAKLSEEEANEVLAMRGPSTGRVLHRLEPVRFSSRSTVTNVPASRSQTHPRVTRVAGAFDVPAMSLREYADVVCLPGQVVTSGNLVLPDTYRHGRRGRLGNRNMHDLAPRFAVPKQRASDVRELEGAYFYLDSEYRGHYGHAMTEQLSRLWAWSRAKEAEPGLRALMSVTKWGPELHEFERMLYGAAGIPAEDLMLVDGPVRVERLLAATPMLSQPDYIHPDIRETWATVSRALAEQAPGRDYPRRIFCARRASHRACRNSEEVEALFVRFGFTVVYPERFSLPEQAMMFRSAEVVGGYAGSALINLCLTESPKHVILVSSDGYTAKNEYVIASVLGHSLDVVWCNAETPMPERGWSARAFMSGFSMDLEREGRELAEILSSLTTGSEVDA